jgi:hypothetical protein
MVLFIWAMVCLAIFWITGSILLTFAILIAGPVLYLGGLWLIAHIASIPAAFRSRSDPTDKLRNGAGVS